MVVLAAAGGALTAVVPSAAAGAASAAPAAQVATTSDTVDVRVAMTENDGNNLVVYDPGGGVSAPGVANSPAVLFEQTTATAGTWRVYHGTGCAGPTWHLVSTGVNEPVASPVVATQPLQLCIVGGNTIVQGTLTALYNSAHAARTVNTLPLEEYVADTVPGESPSYWATLGGPGPGGRDWGFQELEAQAVAVRSYVLSNLGGYGGYADTCDLTCQTYRGLLYVSPASIAAAQETAGQVMAFANGSIATTEYSASTGGFTSGPTQGSPFTPVPDTGDAVCVSGACNPNHDWTATASASSIEAAWPQIGTFTALSNVSTDGGDDPGDHFGRVDHLTVVGTSGTVNITGAGFADTLGLKSDFFEVASQSGGGVTFDGHGWGHGIGMGQWGALGYAIGQDNGQGAWTYQQIVTHYYGPASLETLPGAPMPGVSGYWLAATDGGIFSFGNAHFYGSMGGQRLVAPIVGMAAGSTGTGYRMVAADGGVFSFGSAHFFGSMGGKPLNAPVVGMAAAPTGGGYWLVAADGGIFAFGTAHFFGSMGGKHLNQPIVGMAATPTGQGYWLVAADGGIFAFGSAQFHGSTGALRLDRPVVGMAPTSDGGGYWLVAADGGIFTFGDGQFHGSGAGTAAGQGAVAVLPTSDGAGYEIISQPGHVTPFGDAPGLGDLTTAVPGYAGSLVGASLS
jgi:SpoIID/LytB domain protein